MNLFEMQNKIESRILSIQYLLYISFSRFDKGDKSQVQTCLKDEACLMYSWKKSPTEVATLRECFPTRVLLGSIADPLTPSR